MSGSKDGRILVHDKDCECCRLELTKKRYLLFEDEGFTADFAGVVLLSRVKSLVSDNTAS